MGKYSNFYNLYQRCITGKIYWRKHINQSISLNDTLNYLKEHSKDNTLYKRNYIKYSDFLTCQNITEELIRKNDRSHTLQKAHDMWGSTAYHLITHAGTQMIDSNKIFITKEREDLFNLTDIAPSFTINDLNITQTHTIYLESQPDTLYLIRREIVYNPNIIQDQSELYRWCLITIRPKHGTDFINQEIYIEGVTMSLSDLYNCNATAILRAESSIFSSDDHGDEMMSNANKMIPLIIKALLYMKAVYSPYVNQHDEAHRIHQKNIPMKRKMRLLATAPQFLVRTLYAPDKEHTQYLNTQSNDISVSLPIRGHWVRGHFRKQRYGKQLKESKIIFIEPFFKGDADNMVDVITKI